MSNLYNEETTVPMPHGCKLNITETKKAIGLDSKTIHTVWQKVDTDGNVIAYTDGKSMYAGNLYRNGELVFAYNASLHGAVKAIRIRHNERYQSIATIVFCHPDVPTIDINWCSNERDAFYFGINGYTKIFDERFAGQNFEEFCGIMKE